MTNSLVIFIINIMEIYGKKQINIREDNKSAVIDVLLQSHATMLDMSEKLGLSHTSLAKVIRELMQKNVVQIVNYDTSAFGRPSKVYGINGDCAISCAIVFNEERVYVYYFDMRGFQINEITFENDCRQLQPLVLRVIQEMHRLKQHPRLNEKIIKYVYVGAPSVGLFGYDFNVCSEVFLCELNKAFPDVRLQVWHNEDYEMIAEKKYGLLKNGEKNVALVNLGKHISASVMIGGEIYRGDNNRHGEFTVPSEPNGEYTADKIEPLFKELSCFLSFMDIHEVVLGGDAQKQDKNLLDLVKKVLGNNVNVRFSTMGADVPSSLSGAVWLAVYSTLQELMAR